MNIAITLVIQGFVFFFVAWLVMKYIWPFLLVKIETRQKVIAEGLAAAAKSEKDLNEAEARSKEIIREARERAAQIVDQASKRSNEMIEEAKGTASSEAQRLIASAHEEVNLETTRARESLRREVGELAVEGASRLLGREIDPRTHAELLDKLPAEIVVDPRVTELVKNPELPSADIAEFIIGVAGDKLDAHMQNFVRVLAENHRLLLLPEILAPYEARR